MLTQMQRKWVDFDVVGKTLFLEQVRPALTVSSASERGVVTEHAAIAQMQDFTERLGVHIAQMRGVHGARLA